MVNYKWCVSAGKLEHNFLDAAFMDITLICNQWEVKEEVKLSWELRLWKLYDFFPITEIMFLETDINKSSKVGLCWNLELLITVNVMRNAWWKRNPHYSS